MNIKCIDDYSNSPSDYLTILLTLEGECRLDLDDFDLLKRIIFESKEELQNIDCDLFLKRSALMNLSASAIDYLSGVSDREIEFLINDIAAGYHPLMEAVSKGDLSSVLFLLKCGANPNHGTEPWFPLLQADQQKNLEIITVLEEYGANWNDNVRVYNEWSVTPYKSKLR